MEAVLVTLVFMSGMFGITGVICLANVVKNRDDKKIESERNNTHYLLESSREQEKLDRQYEVKALIGEHYRALLNGSDLADDINKQVDARIDPLLKTLKER